MLTRESGGPGHGPDRIAGALAANRLGAPSVVYFVMSAAAPLTVVAGVLPTAIAATGITGLPIAFIAIGLVLALFSVGYVAMARHMANAGAFYTYISRGLGRPAGVPAAWVAILAYNGLAVGAFFMLGVQTSALLEGWLGAAIPWWAFALLAWAVVAALGVLRVDVNGKLLAVLLTAEVAIILLFNLGDLINPSPAGLTLETLSPGLLFTEGVAPLIVIATLGFVGFEAAVVFSEESREPRRTVPLATYASVAIIAGLYALSAWALSVATGPANLVAAAQKDGPEMIFVLGGAHFGGVVVDIARVLFITSLLAACISFHNTIARYLFALGRERIIPDAFGRTSLRTGAPRTASIAQSTLALVVILAVWLLGADPIQAFFVGGATGGAGVLLLLFVTAVAVIAFFAREPGGESLWHRLIAPVPAALILAVMAFIAFTNFEALLGVPEGDPLAMIIPIVYAAVAVIGVVWALILRSTQPGVYALVGMGAKAATAKESAR
ncbi:APC family permease [Nonomuraea soli]|uniref:Amino acid transporter n=1 Tax=Nonomuraea soli TaxID=1032476 RepID=A0A7W0CH58_9ACTN|nr:APC family permease [Nonomuraea soli]MBA2891016.1 amino acid transporter [Nonomuraea soli]